MIIDESAADAGWAAVAAKWAAAAVASWWVSTPAAIQALLVLMLIDYATGLICAALQGRLSSADGFRGLARKSLTLLLVATGSFMSHSMHLGIDVGSTVAMAFAANELISITENCARAGVPIPESLLIVVVRAKKLAGRSKTPAEVEEELSAALGEAQKTK